MALLTVLLSASASLQTASAQSAPQAPATVAAVDAAFFAGRTADALTLCDSLLAHDSTNIEILWRASRAALALGINSARQEADNPMYLRAEALARTAAQRHPKRIEGHYWLSAALGRRALHADLRTTVRLAKTTYDAALHALAIDSMHAGANNVIGKLNSEVRKFPAIYRIIAGRLLGLSVANHTSWELAERHLRRAVDLDPAMVLYRLDLGELYVRMGRRADAERLLREAIALPRVQPVDATLQREAVALLEAATAKSQP